MKNYVDFENKKRKKETQASYFVIFFLVGIIGFLGSAISTQKKIYTSSIEIDESETPAIGKTYAPIIPKGMEIFGERVPIEDIEVYERLDREIISNTYLHSATILAFKRANRWFPLFEQVLKKHKVPDDFKYLAIVESNLSNAISPKGATGFWQFMESAGNLYGLEINSEVDERYNVEKSTEAACKYLLDSYAKFNSWTLSAASYNMGVAGASNQINLQKTKNYFDLYLNEETSRYVIRIAAVKCLFENPKFFGYEIPSDQLYKPWDTQDIEIKESIDDLVAFAKKYSISYKTLKYYNPWLRNTKLTIKGGKKYIIRIPKTAGSNFLLD